MIWFISVNKRSSTANQRLTLNIYWQDATNAKFTKAKATNNKVNRRHNYIQESRAVARKPRDAAIILMQFSCAGMSVLRSLQSRFPIDDVLLRFRDIRDQVAKLSEIAPKLCFRSAKLWREGVAQISDRWIL